MFFGTIVTVSLTGPFSKYPTVIPTEVEESLTPDERDLSAEFMPYGYSR